MTAKTPAPVATSSRPKRSNGGRLHAINPTATGSPTAIARATVSSTTVVDDAAEAETRTDTAPIATAAPIPTMSSRLELRTAGPSSTQAPARSTHRPRRADPPTANELRSSPNDWLAGPVSEVPGEFRVLELDAHAEVDETSPAPTRTRATRRRDSGDRSPDRGRCARRPRGRFLERLRRRGPACWTTGRSRPAPRIPNPFEASSVMSGTTGGDLAVPPAYSHGAGALAPLPHHDRLLPRARPPLHLPHRRALPRRQRDDRVIVTVADGKTGERFTVDVTEGEPRPRRLPSPVRLRRLTGQLHRASSSLSRPCQRKRYRRADQRPALRPPRSRPSSTAIL